MAKDEHGREKMMGQQDIYQLRMGYHIKTK